MIRVIDLAGYVAPMMMLLMTREMSLRVLGMFGHVAVVIFSIVVCLLPVLSPHLMLLPMSALRLWHMLTGTPGAESSQDADGPSDSDRSLSSEVSMVEAHFDNWLSGQPINENANFNENQMAVTVPEYPSNSQ